MQRPPPSVYQRTTARVRRLCVDIALLGLLVLVGAVIMVPRVPGTLVPGRWGVAPAMPLAAVQPTARIAAVPDVLGAGDVLGTYVQDSEHVGSVAGVGAYRRQIAGGGTVAFVVVPLASFIRVSTITADGAIPDTDATGDTSWSDGGLHLQSVPTMSTAVTAQRPGYRLVAAMAFGFHGARTADEGTILIDGAIAHVNAGRSAVCIDGQQRVTIGLFDHDHLARCVQAFGAGPVVMQDGKIAHPDRDYADDQWLPFNPLHEDFVQLDWRRMIYRGIYPKTMIGIGTGAHGTMFLVLLNAYGMDGVATAEQLRAMGCSDAIGGDEDTSTQLVWQGTMLVNRPARPVPTAVAVFVATP